MARREEGEYREYLTDEQRRQAGCISGRMQRHFHDGLLLGHDRSSDARSASPRATARRRATRRQPGAPSGKSPGGPRRVRSSDPITRCRRGVVAARTLHGRATELRRQRPLWVSSHDWLRHAERNRVRRPRRAARPGARAAGGACRVSRSGNDGAQRRRRDGCVRRRSRLVRRGRVCHAAVRTPRIRRRAACPYGAQRHARRGRGPGHVQRQVVRSPGARVTMGVSPYALAAGTVTTSRPAAPIAAALAG